MKLFNKFKKLSSKSKLIVTSLMLCAAVGVPVAVHAGFFPDRPTYDYNKYDPNNLNCDDPNNIAAQDGRCGSMNGPVFNSFINTPSYGDERYFVDGRRTDQPASSTADTIKDVTEGSHQLTIRMYVHNNANQDTNASGKGIAHNTKVSLELPKVSGSALQAVGAITADNAAPHEVTDTVYMTASRPFHVSYVPGSARLLRGNASYQLSDSIASGGALIGNTVMDGNLPGCFDYAALVEVTVNVTPEQSTNLQVLKQVKKVGDPTGWHKEVGVKPGDQEQWMLTTKNIALDQLTNVQVRDILPPHVALVPGSVKIVNADGKSYDQADAPLFGNGLGLGTYPSGGGRYVLFKTTAKDDFNGCSVRIRNIAKAKSTETPTEVQDTADVVITKENCAPSAPAYSCDALTATIGDNRTVRFQTTASAVNGAQITMYQYNFGDGTTLNTDKPVVDHTYAQAGQYAARVSVLVNVNGQTKTAVSDKCATAINFTNVSVTGKPTSLPNTGAGDMAGIFTAVTLASAFAYRWALGRRLSRQ